MIALRITLRTLAALLFALFAAQLFAAELTEYSAKYSASANGLRAQATRSLSRDISGSYHLSNVLVAEIAGIELAALSETSTFTLQTLTPIPQSYSYSLTGLGHDTKSIVFDWDNQVGVSTEDSQSWELQLEPSTQDPLSYQAALQLQLAEGDLTELAWPIVNGDKIEIQHFRIEGKEMLETPAGRLQCIKLVRVRADASRSTTIWLAQDWSYLLAKIEQVNSSVKIVLELESATVNGVVVAN
jgi:hypothetical protein